ncbi:MAG: hypothetical protein KGL57_05950 [Burkholderiales bacterium]|nr:hypothetical protein [Burkholderiales bacterium]
MKAATRILSTTVLALASLTAAGGAWATIEPMDDEALSNSYAGDGTEGTKLPNSSFLNFATAMLQISAKNAKVLSREEFVGTMAALGVTAMPASAYDGRPVTEVTLPSNPVTTTVKLSQFISSMTGVKYDAPGMGNITIQNFDAGGTRLWVWGH